MHDAILHNPMALSRLPIVADVAPTPLVESAPTFESARLDLLAESWQLALFAATCALIVAFCWWMVRRDSVELRPGVGYCLLALRLGALVGVLAFFLQYEKRVDRLDVYDSRVLVLVDTSTSMARTDPDLSGPPATVRRIDQVIDELTGGDGSLGSPTDGGMVEALRKKHQVHVLRFDREPKADRLATLDKRRGPREATDVASTAEASSLDAPSAPHAWWRVARRTVPGELWRVLAGVLVVSQVLAAAWMLQSRRTARTSAGQWLWALSGSIAPAVPVMVLMALVVDQRNAVDKSVVDENAIRNVAAGESVTPVSPPSSSSPSSSSDSPSVATTDWRTTLREKLQPKGTETRLGQALRQLVHDQRGNPIAGIVVLTDGGNNAGVEPSVAARDAKGAGIPIYPVGLGSDRQRTGVRIGDFAVPARVFPDDSFDIAAFVQATGMAGRTLNVELFSKPGAGGETAPEKREAAERVKLGADGESIPVKFVLPPGAVGRRTYIVRVDKPVDDHDPTDNEAQATVEVIERSLHVLLLAGGPTREYQYLRNQFHRDPHVKVDVLLQTAKPGPGISQDADDILADFPRTKPELAKYDAILAFDPDWRQLDEAQVDLLEDWVGSQSGGLVAIAGPVNTAAWSSDAKAAARMNKIRALYPVTLPRRGLQLLSDAEKFRSKTAWAIELTRAGLEAPFLRLDESAAASAQAWAGFEGVYGYFPATGHKPGATVYARYSTPDAAGELPVYFAGQFYGGGRAFYIGSGEMWRIRALDVAYYEKFYTKLVRHVAEGRLLRGSRRGSLLLDGHKFTLGDNVDVQAVLKNVNLEPLDVKTATVQVSQPDGTAKTVHLAPHETRKGMFRGTYVCTQTGAFKIEMEVPGGPHELVSDHFRVVEPDLENDRARRDDAVLRTLAEETGGKYYVGVAATRGTADRRALADELVDATRLVRVRGMSSPQWDERWATCLLFVVTGMLFAEWTLRRLVKLA